MNLNKALINRLLYVLLILSCASGYSWSQESDKPEADRKTIDAPIQAPNADTSEPQVINESSPTDYQASEEISQDLSVSFPADI